MRAEVARVLLFECLITCKMGGRRWPKNLLEVSICCGHSPAALSSSMVGTSLIHQYRLFYFLLLNIQINLDQIIPAIEEPEDTEWIKHIKFKSEKLSKFWGRDMYLGAHVLLPKGFDEHPEASYPLMIFHGHFPTDFGGFRTMPPDENLKPEYSERFHVDGYNITEQQEAYNFYKRWNEPDFPRFLIIEIQHPTPYYDDSYAVNSASQGPYGDAITYELIPEIEKQFMRWVFAGSKIPLAGLKNRRIAEFNL